MYSSRFVIVIIVDNKVVYWILVWYSIAWSGKHILLEDHIARHRDILVYAALILYVCSPGRMYHSAQSVYLSSLTQLYRHSIFEGKLGELLKNIKEEKKTTIYQSRRKYLYIDFGINKKKNDWIAEYIQQIYSEAYT